MLDIRFDTRVLKKKIPKLVLKKIRDMMVPIIEQKISVSKLKIRKDYEEKIECGGSRYIVYYRYFGEELAVIVEIKPKR